MASRPEFPVEIIFKDNMRIPLQVCSPIPSRNGTDSVRRILEAAEALFSKQGFDAVSVNDISARAGVSKANVFHHFSSKRDLYLAVLQSASQKFGSAIDEFDGGKGSIDENLAGFAKAHLARILENEQLSRLILSDVLENAPQQSKDMGEKIFGDNFARLVSLIRGSQENKALRNDIDPAMIAVLLIGANVFFFEAREVLRHFSDVAFVDKPEDFSRMLVDIMLHGILPPAGK